ncbi:MAG: hypothetical protein QOH32_3192 [Bradyrhizobium sp.]|jgi:hypothetical protein|nr:hypothetical protein [Bradyrhizobium sp.]
MSSERTSRISDPAGFESARRISVREAAYQPWLTAAAFIIGVFSLLAIVARLFGVPPLESFKYAVYVTFYVILPGIILYGGVRREPEHWFEFTVKAWVAGSCLEMASALFAIVSGLKGLYPFFPLLYVTIAIAIRQRIVGRITRPPASMPRLDALLFPFVAVTVIVASALYDFRDVLDQHFTWIAAFANVAVNFWPIPEPFLMGVPLNYHYLFNIHVGMASYTLNIPTILVASRLAIILHVFLFMGMIYAFCRSWLCSGWIGLAVCLQILFTFGVSQPLWDYFHFATAAILYELPSATISLAVFLLLSDEVLRLFDQKQTQTAPYLLLGLLLLVASGVRANLLPVFIGGLGFLLLGHIRDPADKRRAFCLLIAAVASFSFGLWFFYGLGGPGDGTKLLFLDPLNAAVSEVGRGRYSPVFAWLVAHNVPTVISSGLYLIVALCGRLTFLLPGVLFFWLGKAKTDSEWNVSLLFGGVALAGLAILVFVGSGVPQEVWAFYWYGDVGLAIAGAAGLHWFWQVRAKARVAWSIALTYAALTLGLQVYLVAKPAIAAVVAGSFPQPYPVYSSGVIYPLLVESLQRTAKIGDVLVTGGLVDKFDERPLAASIPGLQLFAPRSVLWVYSKRTPVDSRLKDRLFLLNDRLSEKESLDGVRRAVPPDRTLYLLWIGEEPPPYQDRIKLQSRWAGFSLWQVQ